MVETNEMKQGQKGAHSVQSICTQYLCLYKYKSVFIFIYTRIRKESPPPSFAYFPSGKRERERAFSPPLQRRRAHYLKTERPPTPNPSFPLFSVVCLLPLSLSLSACLLLKLKDREKEKERKKKEKDQLSFLHRICLFFHPPSSIHQSFLPCFVVDASVAVAYVYYLLIRKICYFLFCLPR